MLKFRLVVHGNRDHEKYELRKDSIAAYMMTTRMFLALGIIMGFQFRVADN